MKQPRIRNTDRPVVHKYAETWLNEAVDLLRPIFKDAGYEIPPVHVSVGFGMDGYKPRAKKNTIAVCHARCMTSDGINEIYISPIVHEPVEVLGILVHELIHAVDDCKSGHGEQFQKISQELGSPDNLSVPSEIWRRSIDRYRKIADQLGRYPRSGVNYRTAFDFDLATN
jgi:hypothetical protein